MTTPPYSVPTQAAQLLKHGLIFNSLHQSCPAEVQDTYKLIEFRGADLPSIPVNWRLAESIAAIKGFEASMLNVLLRRKLGIEPPKIVIDTDHAQLFFMAPLISTLNVDGKELSPFGSAEFSKWFPSKVPVPHNTPCTNIYRTRDDRFYHIYGGLDPRPSQSALGIPENHIPSPGELPSTIYEQKVSQIDAKTLDELINDQYRQAGTICQSVNEYLSSEQGKANAHVGLYELHHIPRSSQPPSWWEPPSHSTVDSSRPLRGLKVLDLSRIIAAPTISRELAELGASVLRITSPNIPDLEATNFDLGWGKWSAHLDLTDPEARERLKVLIYESDVVIDGYRPGVMEKWGFGKDDIIRMTKHRVEGIIYVRVNCYGWNGPLAHRSGWQQISDAHCGVSAGYGHAMKHEEPVTPVFPHCDYSTGVSGATGVLHALIERAEKGGTFVLDVALNYYSQWLVRTGLKYPPNVWDHLWTKHQKPVFRHIDNMQVTIPTTLGLLRRNTPGLFNPEFLEIRYSKAIGAHVSTVKPILQFPDGAVKPGFNVGCRPNGVDKAVWPTDLMVEVVT
ncbi:hypothetical protein PQX77_021098 [Marasmius sp. AFHP31]|nr:hypothetical protein PQX77_021098 [Marasmius sp. AFHP31]